MASSAESATILIGHCQDGNGGAAMKSGKHPSQTKVAGGGGVMDFTDGNKFDGEFKDKTAWALSILTGEKVESYTKTQSKASAFLPLVEVFQVGDQTFTYKDVQQAKAKIRWTPPADYQYSNKFTALDLL